MNDEELPGKWLLKLYIVGMTPTAKRALANIHKICHGHLSDRYSVEVIDLLERPALAESDQIFAVPTLVRKFPLPLRKIIGDLADSDKVVAGLGIAAP